MRLSKNDDIKYNLLEPEASGIITLTLYDRQYLKKGTKQREIAESIPDSELASLSVTLERPGDENRKTALIKCRILYGRIDLHTSAAMKTLLKKFRKYSKSIALVYGDDSYSSGTAIPSYNNSPYGKTGRYSKKPRHNTDAYINWKNRLESMTREIKTYIQYHPITLQAIGDIREYKTVAWNVDEPKNGNL